MTIATLLWAGALVLIILILGALKTRAHLGFSFRVFIAMLLGMGLGLSLYFFDGGETAGEARKWFALVGYGYVDLLRMLIIPLVPASIIGLVTASLMGIGAGIDTSGRAAREQQGIVELFTRLRGFIPANPVASAAEMQMIPLVVFSLFVGIAGVIEMGKNPERVEPFRKILESFLTVIMRVTKMVISLTPYGVAGLMAYRMSNTGLSAISDLGLFVAGVVIACLIQIGVVYSGLLLTLPRVSPLRFFKAASPAMLLAFTSRSSIIGTLTLTTAGLPVEAIGLVVVGDRLGEFDREAFNSPFPSPSLS